jgi:hypothetical protein
MLPSIRSCSIFVSCYCFSIVLQISQVHIRRQGAAKNYPAHADGSTGWFDHVFALLTSGRVVDRATTQTMRVLYNKDIYMSHPLMGGWA